MQGAFIIFAKIFPQHLHPKGWGVAKGSENLNFDYT